MTPDQGHQRTATTPMEDGTLVADCSCGGTYSIEQGASEYTRLEAERLRHMHDYGHRSGA